MLTFSLVENILTSVENLGKIQVGLWKDCGITGGNLGE
jgi:hypothetical protein